MMPAQMRVKSVEIYYGVTIMGLQFYDRDNNFAFEIGYTTSMYFKVKTVVLENNEVIIGVVAKLYAAVQFSSTNFQFQIAAKWRLPF